MPSSNTHLWFSVCAQNKFCLLQFTRVSSSSVQLIYFLCSWAFIARCVVFTYPSMVARYDKNLWDTHVQLHHMFECNWRAQWKKGITVFDNPKRSKVNTTFLVSRKITRLDFNSTQTQLLNFSHNSLLDNKNASLTFDLLGSSWNGYPLFPLSPSISQHVIFTVAIVVYMAQKPCMWITAGFVTFCCSMSMVSKLHAAILPVKEATTLHIHLD